MHIVKDSTEKQEIKKEIDLSFLDFSYRIQRESGYEPEYDLKEINLKIKELDLNSDDEKYDLVGTIKATSFSDLIHPDYDEFLQLCDDHSSELYRAFLGCFKKDRGGDFSFKKNDVLEDKKIVQSFENVLYINHMEIVPELRNIGYGKLAVRTLAKDIGQDSVFLVKPWPIEKENQTKKEFDQEMKKVRAFWESCGFGKIGNEGYYISTYVDIIFDQFI